MEVTTTGERLESHRATLTDLLLSDQPDPAEDPKQTTTRDNELLLLVREYGLEKHEDVIPLGEGRGLDDSNPVIAVNHDACILRDRCVRLRRHPGQRRDRFQRENVSVSSHRECRRLTGTARAGARS